MSGEKRNYDKLEKCFRVTRSFSDVYIGVSAHAQKVENFNLFLFQCLSIEIYLFLFIYINLLASIRYQY